MCKVLHIGKKNTQTQNGGNWLDSNVAKKDQGFWGTQVSMGQQRDAVTKICSLGAVLPGELCTPNGR